MIRKIFELLFGRVYLRVQFIEISVVELSGDRFVDKADHSILPERRIFI